MAFKESKAFENSKGKFTSEMSRFVSHEAGQFTSEGNEAASANVDAAIERAVHLSSEKNRSKAKEIRAEIKELEIKAKNEDKQQFYQKSQNENIQITSQFHKSENIEHKKFEEKAAEQKSEKESSRFSDTKERTQATATKKKELSKKEKKERKKQATKISVGKMLRSKKEISNELAGGGSNTGDAFHDGKSGLVGSLLEVINPMHYFKMWIAKITAVLAPYVLLFMTVSIVLVVVVALMFQILKPLAEVGNAISGFLSMFTVESDTFTNVALTEEEIDQIVEDSGCDTSQESAIRFALLKVGYPYSQDLRTSGTYYDCSSLVYYAWQAAEVDISYGANYPPTAAEGARILNNKRKCVASGEGSDFTLEPGDLIYYGGSDNGRYLGIYHVAIYIGNGKAVEALNTTYGVVYQTLRTKNVIMVCRPN